MHAQVLACMCMYVCVLECIYKHMYGLRDGWRGIHVYERTDVRMYACSSVQMYVCLRACMQACAFLLFELYIMYPGIQVGIYASICLNQCVFVFLRLPVCSAGCTMLQYCGIVVLLRR